MHTLPLEDLVARLVDGGNDGHAELPKVGEGVDEAHAGRGVQACMGAYQRAVDEVVRSSRLPMPKPRVDSFSTASQRGTIHDLATARLHTVMYLRWARRGRECVAA